MKRERRHELQHNDLAEWILKNYERIVPYRNAILGVGLLVVVLVIGISFWHSHSAAQAGEAWNSLGIPVFQPVFADPTTIERMQNAARTNAGMPAAEWAQVFAGDSALMNGTNRIVTDKKAGIEFLTQARDIYGKALETLTIPGAQEQAMFGKARAMESLIENKSQRDETIAAYQDLNKKFPDGMFKAIADQRVAQLQKKETMEFYEALAQYAPKPKVKGIRSQLENLGNLNPPDELPVPTTPIRPDGSRSGPILGIPEPSLTPTEPGKSSTPKKEAPKTEPAKPQAVKTDAPKPDAPKADAPKADTPKTDVPKSDAPKADAPKPEAVKKDK